MKTLTFRLLQFFISALLLSILFRYILNLCIGVNSEMGTLFCSIVYFCLMFLIGWYFGKKDAMENEIHDIGFRFHLITYILCIGAGFGAYYVNWYTETPKSMIVTATCWGIGVLIHFLCFIIERKKTIKGYSKDQIFQ